MSERQPPPEPTEELAGGSMSFLEHLAELRMRLMRSIYAVLLGTLGCYLVAEPIYGWLAEPLLAALPPEADHLVFLNPIEPFLVYVQVALIAGILAASPVVLYQIWRFVAPGLYARERRAVAPFVLFGTLFFVGGALFCRYVVLPYGLETLMGVGFDSASVPVEPQITMDAYLDVSTKLILAFGVVFELPVLVLFLSWAHIITYRTLLTHWRGAIVGCAVVGAVLTPPDVVTMTMLTIPLIVLYFFSVGVAWVFGSRK